MLATYSCADYFGRIYEIKGSVSMTVLSIKKRAERKFGTQIRDVIDEKRILDSGRGEEEEDLPVILEHRGADAQAHRKRLPALAHGGEPASKPSGRSKTFQPVHSFFAAALRAVKELLQDSQRKLYWNVELQHEFNPLSVKKPDRSASRRIDISSALALFP